MSYHASITKKQLIQMLNEVPDDYEILIVKGGEPLWFTGEVVDLAMGEEDGESESLQHAVGLIACDEDGN